MLAKLVQIRAAQTNLEHQITGLACRVDALEQIPDTSHLPPDQTPNTNLNHIISRLSSENKVFTEKCDYSDNRLRRPIQLFLGIPDSKDENWAKSEEHVVLCLEQLDNTITNNDIERAQRLGFSITPNIGP